MAIGIWLLIIGLLIIIAGVVIFYVTSILSTTWLWVIIGGGVLLIIVGAILFFMNRKKPAPPKKEMPPMQQPIFIPPEPEPVIQQPMYPPYMPQNPLVIPSGNNGNTDLAILLQQQNFQQQQQIRDLENKFEKQQERERDDRRYRQLEAKLLAQNVQQPMPNVIVPPNRQLIPAQVQRGGQAMGVREAFINPQVISGGINAGVAGLQVAPQLVQAFTQPQLVELGTTIAGKVGPTLLSAVKGVGSVNNLGYAMKAVGSTSKLITH